MPNIFIVDDSISVRKALEITLRNQSMTSSSAVSGEDALEALGSGRECDLMMVDVIMPGMSGLDLCREVKNDPRHAHLPVILMSGNVDDEVRTQAREVGADGVLRKPFRSEELIPMVESVLSDYREKYGSGTPAASAEATGPGSADVTDVASAEATSDGPAIAQGDLSALTEMLQRYEDHPRVRDVVILDRQGQPIRQTGNVLPENIQMFARFFTNTAGVLGKQMLGEDITEVSIRYGAHEMVIHNLPAHFVVVLMGEDGAGNALKA